MRTATLIKNLEGWRGHAALYELEPPLTQTDFETEKEVSHKYVVASAADVPHSGPETYLFAADANGEVTCWMELEGSSKGIFEHAEAFANAGYQIADNASAKI